MAYQDVELEKKNVERERESNSSGVSKLANSKERRANSPLDKTMDRTLFVSPTHFGFICFCFSLLGHTLSVGPTSCELIISSISLHFHFSFFFFFLFQPFSLMQR